MISNNQYQGVTSFSNAFFYILSVDFSGAVSRFPLNLLRRTPPQKDTVAIGARAISIQQHLKLITKS
jgi:hypothetical protein